MGAVTGLKGLLLRLLHLEEGDFRNLTFLYLATFLMRAAAWAGVAVMQRVLFTDPKDALWKGLLFSLLPLAEIASVGYFGTLCDRIGRKKILVLAHVVTAAAVFLFIPAVGPGVPGDLRPYLVAAFFAMFGIGAAAKVGSTLAMVNDHSHLANRAQLMALFDLVTFGGLVLGYGAAYVALASLAWDPAQVLLVAGLGVVASAVLVWSFVAESQRERPAALRTRDMLREVFRDRDVVRLLPVYIPVVALYGYVLTFTDHLISGGCSKLVGFAPLLGVVLAIGIPLGLSMAVMSRYSDVARLRRPFMLLGLLCFGLLAIVISLAEDPGCGTDVPRLVAQWPLLAALAFGAGAFPPAALAYLGDIIHRSVSGTAFGVYSIIFGSGLIVGPIVGGALTEALGPLAFVAIALSLIAISATGVLFIRESARRPAAERAAVVPTDPPRDRSR